MTRLNEEQQLRLNQQIAKTLVRLEHDAERHRGAHFYHVRRTDIYVKLVIALVVILGLFNIYYLSHSYDQMYNIVDDITDMNKKVIKVSTHMISLTDTMEKVNTHIDRMPLVSLSTKSISDRMPNINNSIHNMLLDMNSINHEMDKLTGSLDLLNANFNNITTGIDVMGGNVNQLSRPMGVLNNFLP